MWSYVNREGDFVRKIAFVNSGILPVPPVKGGAVENLIYNIIKENENWHKCDIVSYSLSDENLADITPYKKKYTEYKFITTPNWIRFISYLFYRIALLLNVKQVHSYRYIGHRLYYLKKVADDLAKREDIDIVILENHMTTYLTMRLHENYKKYHNRYVYHAHNEIGSFYHMKDLFDASVGFLTVSQYIANTLERKGAKQSNVHVVHNSVDAEKFQNVMTVTEKEVWLNKFGLEKKDRIVLFVGRLIPEKGIKEAINGFIKSELKNVKMMIVGNVFFDQDVNNSYENDVTELIKKSSGKIFATGYVPYEDMPKLYQLADVTLLPSLWNEPALLTGIESKASGTPVITTDAGGIPEYIDDECGYVLKRDEKLVENISNALREIFTDDEKRMQMGTKGIEKSKGKNRQSYYISFMKALENSILEK